MEKKIWLQGTRESTVCTMSCIEQTG